ncbi:MAG: GNAT family N-acetyltransferase [Parachlamydiales bacterium]|nr:GNAT family N-acetyltransferase [Parachlamydiales bacterium]
MITIFTTHQNNRPCNVLENWGDWILSKAFGNRRFNWITANDGQVVIYDMPQVSQVNSVYDTIFGVSFAPFAMVMKGLGVITSESKTIYANWQNDYIDLSPLEYFKANQSQGMSEVLGVLKEFHPKRYFENLFIEHAEKNFPPHVYSSFSYLSINCQDVLEEALRIGLLIQKGYKTIRIYIFNSYINSEHFNSVKDIVDPMAQGHKSFVEFHHCSQLNQILFGNNFNAIFASNLDNKFLTCNIIDSLEPNAHCYWQTSTQAWSLAKNSVKLIKSNIPEKSFRGLFLKEIKNDFKSYNSSIALLDEPSFEEIIEVILIAYQNNAKKLQLHFVSKDLDIMRVRSMLSGIKMNVYLNIYLNLNQWWQNQSFFDYDFIRINKNVDFSLIQKIAKQLSFGKAYFNYQSNYWKLNPGRNLVPLSDLKSDQIQAVKHDLNLMENFEIYFKVPTPEEYVELRQAASLKRREIESAKIALSNSLFCVTIRSEKRLAAMGRVVGDKGSFVEIVDIAVHPDFQKKGLSKLLMDAIMNFIVENVPKDAFVHLCSEERVVDLYKKYGFVIRDPKDPLMYVPCDNR